MCIHYFGTLCILNNDVPQILLSKEYAHTINTILQIKLKSCSYKLMARQLYTEETHLKILNSKIFLPHFPLIESKVYNTFFKFLASMIMNLLGENQFFDY